MFGRIIHPVTNRPDSSCRNCFKCCRQNLKSTQEKHDLRRFAIDTREQRVVNRFHAGRLPPIGAHRFWHQPQMRWHPIDIKKRHAIAAFAYRKPKVDAVLAGAIPGGADEKYRFRIQAASDEERERWRRYGGVHLRGLAKLELSHLCRVAARPGRWNRGSISRTDNRHSRELAAAAIPPARDILAR